MCTKHARNIVYTAPSRSPNNALHSSSYYLRVLFSYACCTIYSSLSVEVILLVIGMVGLGLSMLLGLIKCTYCKSALDSGRQRPAVISMAALLALWWELENEATLHNV